MRNFLINFAVAMFIFVICMYVSTNESLAAINSSGIMDNVLERYKSASSAWSSSILTHATRLFWFLVITSMVWTFGKMALQKEDLQAFFSEFLMFTIFTGFYLWIMTNGPAIAVSIVDSLKQIGSTASGSSDALSPSTITDMGFNVFYRTVDNMSILSPTESTAGVLMGLAVLASFSLIAVNVLITLCAAWILMYAGIFFLGFGGSKWTTDLAWNYYRTVLNVAVQLFTMILLLSVGNGIITDFFNNMSANAPMKELGVLVVAAVILLGLVTKVPAMVAGIASGAGIGAIGNIGTGAAITALGTAAASLGVASGMMMQAAKNITGIGSAINAANNATSGSSSLPMKAVDMTATLAKGSVSAIGSAGKQALTNLKEGASQTAGGKIASAIRENSASNENSISKGSSKS